MRGEHLTAVAGGGADAGSSPHARGTQRRRQAYVARAGIIPACAGNTSSLNVIYARCGDHPRMRGEHVHSWGLCLS